MFLQSPSDIVDLVDFIDISSKQELCKYDQQHPKNPFETHAYKHNTHSHLTFNVLGHFSSFFTFYSVKSDTVP